MKIGSSVVRLRRRWSSVASSGSGGRKWFFVLTRVSLIAGRSSTWKMTCRSLLPRRFSFLCWARVLGFRLNVSWASSCPFVLVCIELGLVGLSFF